MRNKYTILGRQLTNDRKVTVDGKVLTNANGEIDVNSVGYDFVMRTTSELRTKIIEQKFYKVAPADFMPVDVGEAAWKNEIIQNLSYDIAGGFYEGDVDTMTGNGTLAEVDTAIAPIRMPTIIWAKHVTWNISEVSQASASSNWDPIEGKMKSLKRNWDLGIQETAFLGHPSNSLITGLLNNAEVNINTTLIPKPLSSMTETEFTAFLKDAIAVYFANTNSTEMPDTFVLPTDDYLGLVTPYSSTYPAGDSKLEYMQKAFAAATSNQSFSIKSLSYCQASNNASRGINKNRYLLYKNESDTLSMSIPVDFSMYSAGTIDSVFWKQVAMGQYSGVLINRIPEVLYMDETAV